MQPSSPDPAPPDPRGQADDLFAYAVLLRSGDGPPRPAERSGHVRRVRDSADRRVVHLVYPPEARALARRYSGPLARAAETARGRFDDAQLTTIASFLRTLDAELAARHETPNGAS